MIVYKSEGYYHEYIILLEIDAEGKNDLNREDIGERKYARFKCEEAKIIDIKNKETGESVDNIDSYKKGDFIKEKDISFFLTFEGANEYGNWMRNGCHSKIILRYINGFKIEENSIKDGKYNGICKGWYSNGKLRIECNYTDNVLDGDYNSWYNNGDAELICCYKNGKLEGDYTAFNRDGSVKKSFIYDNGKLIKINVNEPPPKITYFEMHPKINYGMYYPRNMIDVISTGCVCAKN